MHKAGTGNKFNTTVNVNEMKRAARKKGMSLTIFNKPLSKIDVAIQIGKNKIIAGIRWKNGGGHYVVIKGYECKKLDGMYIYINDLLPVKGGSKNA